MARSSNEGRGHPEECLRRLSRVRDEAGSPRNPCIMLGHHWSIGVLTIRDQQLAALGFHRAKAFESRLEMARAEAENASSWKDRLLALAGKP